MITRSPFSMVFTLMTVSVPFKDQPRVTKQGRKLTTPIPIITIPIAKYVNAPLGCIITARIAEMIKMTCPMRAMAMET
jgi:hypothetical protein